MAAEKILYSFVGNRDPFPDGDGEYGPVLSLLQAVRFDRVFLFCTGDHYIERARSVEEEAKRELGLKTPFHFVSLELESVIDHEEIFTRLRRAIGQIPLADERELSVLLDPGTPQMQTVWFLLVRSGLLPARLLQGVPPRFAGGAYKVREVNLRSAVLPEVRAAAAAPPEAGTAASAERWIALRQGERIVGDHPAFTGLLEKARRAATYEVNVLIRGETGTGKGLLARLIHECSGRADQPFVPVNCAAISPALAESELFGHVRGAFTGAERERVGKLRSASGGTIFLDEIGDLPLEVQAKLLKALEDRALTPVGADREVRFDARIIAATNQDLEGMIEGRTFRRDLHERICGVCLALPPLRERPTDIPLLARAHLEAWNAKYGEGKRVSEEAWRLLLEYPWPGNVRELHNSLDSMCATGLGDVLGEETLPAAILAHFRRRRDVPDLPLSLPSEGLDLRALIFGLEKSFYEQALRRAEGNGEKAAALLGLNGPAFRKALRERFGLSLASEAEE